MNGMTFAQLFPYFSAGVPIKRKPWGGYWKYDFASKTITIHLQDGTTMLLTETDDILYTIANIVTDDWEIATDEKCLVPVTGNIN